MSTGKKRLLAYVIMAISVLISVKLVKDIVRLRKSDDRLIEAENELLATKEESRELKLRIEEIESGEWWEKQVRNTLKMSKANEEVVIVPERLIASVIEEKMVEEDQGEERANYKKWWQLVVY